MKILPRYLAVAIACATLAQAGNIHVDASSGDDARDGSTWSAAVRSINRALVIANAAGGADTIHVAAGTYAENVLIQRGDVTLLGGYPQGGGPTRDPASQLVIVNGGGAGPALSVTAGAGGVALASIVVDGFTFTNGRELGRAGIYGAGAGVFVEEAAVVLTNNVIESNTALGNGLIGGGVYLYRAIAGPSRIERNTIRNNRAENGLGGGAAIVDFGDQAAGRTSFSNNQVLGNEAVSLPGADPLLALAQGGGLFAWGGAPVIASNTFQSNRADSQIDASYSGQGGGVYVLDAAPAITNNVIVSNEARASVAPFGAAGGGVYAWWGATDRSGGALLLEGNEIRDNRATGGTGPDQAAGGGVAMTVLGAAAPVLRGNTITANRALGDGSQAGIGGGIFAYVEEVAGRSLRVDGGTMSANAALDGGGGLWLQGGLAGAALAENLLVENNEADFGSGVMIFGDGTLRHARIRGNRVYDPDRDNVSEIRDNCPGLANPVQADADGDGRGDACDADDDGDTVPDASDNCPLVANPGQGMACSGDADGDTVPDASDNCPLVANASQADATLDGVGDACEPAQFDALETNAGGVWVTGDATLTNLEVTRNAGQGLLLVGAAADPGNGTPEDHAAVRITNVTIADNDAAGFITYLASGTRFRDSIVARNLLSDGFDTEALSGGPSSPNMTCDGVYFYDGIASLPCTGTGNLDFADGSPAFAMGPLGDYYLEQLASGGARTFVGVDRGRVQVSSSPVVSLTTRTDAVADSGTVDLGYHYPLPSATFDDPFATSVRVTKPGGRAQLSLTNLPPGVAAVRWFRGRISLLPAEYSHQSPFSGQAGDPECSAPPALPVQDTNAVGDGQAYYYLAVDLSGAVEGSFGRSSLLTLRTRPEDSPTDLVTTCP